MHLERTLHPRELLVRQLSRDRLRQGDEGHVVRHRDQWKADPLSLVGERCGRFRPAEADPEREARQPVLREPAHVLALRPGELADSETGRDQQLAALEPRRRIGQLRDMDPANRVVASAPIPQRGSSPRPGRSAMSRTVSMGSPAPLGRSGQDGTPCERERQAFRPCSPPARTRVCATLSKDVIGRVARRPLRAGAWAGRIRRVSPRSATAVDDVLEARERYVARGVVDAEARRRARRGGHRSRPRTGTVYLDFAGGIACQNTGHGFAPVVAAIHEQVDKFLHQCFMVGTYEPYVEVCRRLAEHSPCGRRGARSRSS